jgi:hypothetical protein
MEFAGSLTAATAAAQCDAVLLTWFVVSYLGVAVGGRFYGHYFFQVLPALCLICSRGSIVLLRISSVRSVRMRTALGAVLIAASLFSVIRFHGRTVTIARQWMRGTGGDADEGWYYGRRNDEEKRLVHALNGANGEPRIRDCSEDETTSEEMAFVWGYRPELYVRARLAPASRFLSSQHLTGVPADVHYAGNGYRALLGTEHTARYRQLLLEDLEASRPKYLIDALGEFNSDLAITKVEELREYMQSYRRRNTVGAMVIYVRRDLLNKPPKPHSKRDS